ncbi:MAG: metal-dependent hydrolase [Candidatus Aenigmarchaeota archaeon]|nr:metal-dependent hydrolase [Candidatus Aenigmarchaeota archaeon]
MHFLRSRVKNIDYRLLLLGSMLPDIIDKPLGLVVLKDILYSGRLVAHTLLFASLLTLLAFGRKSMKLKLLSVGIWLHLLFDMMFLYPRTLLWPGLGNFMPLDYHADFMAQLVSNPYVYVPEIVGFMFLLYVFFRHGLYRKANLLGFLRTGKLE